MSDLRPDAGPPVGGHVRATVEGRVEAVNRRGWFVLRDAAGRAWEIPVPSTDRSAVCSWEQIPHPEAWEPGDVVIDSVGNLYRRVSTRETPWRALGGLTTNSLYPELVPERPLTLLVRGGKPVTQ